MASCRFLMEFKLVTTSSLEIACNKIVTAAVPKMANVSTSDVDLMALVELIGNVIVKVIESCAKNFPPMAEAGNPTDVVVRTISGELRKPSFLARIRFRSMVAAELDKGFFSRYTVDVAREALALAASDEQLTKDVVREVVSPGPLRPNFGF